MGKKIIIFIGSAIVFVALDIFARFLYSQSWFSKTKFSTDLNPFDIITLFVTTVATIWLGIYVAKKLTELRFKKEYLINDVKLIEQEIASFDRNIMQSERLNLINVLPDLNKLKSYIERLTQSLDIFKVNIDISNLDSSFNNLFAKVTNTEGDDLILNDIKKNEINICCNDLILSTRRIISFVNIK